MQEGQPVFAVTVHAVDLYFPAVHTVHAVQTRFVDTVQAVD
jgi:hypothetical protein